MKLEGEDYGLRTREEDGVEVLDGDQTCRANLRIGYSGIPDEYHDCAFPDGTPLAQVIDAMYKEADVLLQNSCVSWGWWPL